MFMQMRIILLLVLLIWVIGCDNPSESITTTVRIDDVWIDEDKIFHFVWDGEEHKAKMVAHRTNHYVKFEFFDDLVNEESAFVEMRIEENELTQSVFIRITDFSDMEDGEEVQELWDNLIHELKEIVGG